MSYFDSPKNRAIWERELNGLRAERERRKREGYRPQIDEKQAVSAEKKEQNPYRRKITLQELEQQEREAVQTARAQKAQRIKEKASQRDMEDGKAPVKQTLEKKSLSKNPGGKVL